MDIKQASLDKHYEWHGKIEIVSRTPIKSSEDLALAYTPGVAQPCLEIAKDEEKSFLLTRRSNLVAVITDGTAVLGLGDIGPAAAMPVMEGKCVLFKEFAGVDAFPLCINSKDVDEIVKTISLLSKSFGGINLEDISAPRCFEIEEKLKKICDIPVFHDDQHGTAIVVAAALINGLKFVKKEMGELKIVINGAGAAGTAIAKLLLSMNFGNILLCDINGILYQGADWMNAAQSQMADITNKENVQGDLKTAIKNADVFIGVSKPNLVTAAMVQSMAQKPIVFPLANPTPEIMPDEAKLGGAAVVGTGRSDFPNQINNVLAFPGIFKGALACRAKEITEEMKIAAAYAIAAMVKEDEITADYIIPNPLNPDVANMVSKAVMEKSVK